MWTASDEQGMSMTRGGDCPQADPAAGTSCLSVIDGRGPGEPSHPVMLASLLAGPPSSLVDFCGPSFPIFI